MLALLKRKMSKQEIKNLREQAINQATVVKGFQEL